MDCGNNKLQSLDLKNGGNTNIFTFNSDSNPSLKCIQVDDSTYSVTNWTVVDPISKFSNNCSVLASVNNKAIGNIAVYPNPVAENLQVQGNNITALLVLDLSGQIIKSFTNVQKSINVSDLAPGTYLLRAISTSGDYHQTFLKQ